MSKQVHMMIERIYERKRQDAQLALEERKKEVYARLPQLEDLDAEIIHLGLKYNRAILMGKSSSNMLMELTREIEVLREKKDKLLAELNLTHDYLQLQFDCKNCNDMGYLQKDNGLSEKCSCYRQQVINYTYSKSNLSNLDSQNFNSFDETIYSDEINEKKYEISISPKQNIINIKKKVIEFINDIESIRYKGLFFMGTTGVGKTFMSYCVGRELMNKGRTVLYLTAPQLFNVIKDYRTSNWNSTQTTEINYNYIMESDCLIIDDLGIEPVTEARYSELLTVLTTRAANDNNRVCKTIISTNLGLKKISEFYTERVVSRILGDFLLFKFAGNDMRLRRK